MTSPRITTTEMEELPLVKKIKFKKSVKALAKTIKDDAELGKLVRKLLHRDRLVKVAKNAKKGVEKKRKEKIVVQTIPLPPVTKFEDEDDGSEFKKECLYCGDTFVATHMSRLYCPSKYNKKDYCKNHHKIRLLRNGHLEDYQKGKTKHESEKSKRVRYSDDKNTIAPTKKNKKSSIALR